MAQRRTCTLCRVGPPGCVAGVRLPLQPGALCAACRPMPRHAGLNRVAVTCRQAVVQHWCVQTQQTVRGWGCTDASVGANPIWRMDTVLLPALLMCPEPLVSGTGRKLCCTWSPACTPVLRGLCAQDAMHPRPDPDAPCVVFSWQRFSHDNGCPAAQGPGVWVQWSVWFAAQVEGCQQ